MWDLHPDGTYRRAFVSNATIGADWLRKLDARYEVSLEVRTELLTQFVPTRGVVRNAVLLKGTVVERVRMAQLDRTVVTRSLFNQIGRGRGWHNADLELFCLVADSLTPRDIGLDRMHIWQIRTVQPARDGFRSFRFTVDHEMVLEQGEIDNLWGCDATLYAAPAQI